jgi:hypothetical protein
LLPAHLYFASSKLLFSALFATFVLCLPPFCILEALFLCFNCSTCSLPTSILHLQSFISLLNLLPLFLAHFYFASSKLPFSALFATFALCPPPFYILKASFLCFICYLCSLSTFILHPRSLICLLCLFPLLLAHLHFASLKLHFFAALFCLFPVLPIHLRFASSKVHFSTLFAPFTLYPPSICIFKASFLYFVFSLCSLSISILYT